MEVTFQTFTSCTFSSVWAPAYQTLAFRDAGIATEVGEQNSYGLPLFSLVPVFMGLFRLADGGLLRAFGSVPAGLAVLNSQTIGNAHAAIYKD